ncbi:hypothetical protein AgCh_017601 [Apium graveolens]
MSELPLVGNVALDFDVEAIFDQEFINIKYDESSIHQLYRPLLMGFGAQKWVVTLQRQCDFLATIMSSAGPSEDHSVITSNGKRSMAKLVQRMTPNFCAGVCATMHKWEVVQVGNMGEDARLMIRRGAHRPGEPSGIILSATMSVWIPIQPQQLFDLLQNDELRSRWDLLSHGGQLQQMVCIAKGQDSGNRISISCANVKLSDYKQNDASFCGRYCGSLILVQDDDTARWTKKSKVEFIT